MTQLPQSPFRKTFLAQNQFGTPVPGADEAGASTPAPTQDASAALSSSCSATDAHQSHDDVTCGKPSGRKPDLGIATELHETAAIDSCQEPVAADLIPSAALAEPTTRPREATHEHAAIGRTAGWIPATGATDLLQALGALSGTDLIHEIFAVKPKHFKLKHKLKLPPFAPDYEAIWNAMHDPDAPRMLAGDPVWADEPPLFLRDAS